MPKQLFSLKIVSLVKTLMFMDKSDIDSKCCIIVEGFIRQKLGEITVGASDMILFFYAKPINIGIYHKSQMITILYCEAIDCWSSLCNKIRYKFNYNLLPENLSFSYNGKFINKYEWESVNPREFDVFIINPFIHRV